MPLPPTVFIVEDEQPVRLALEMFLAALHIRSQSFASAENLLESYRADWTGCLLVDLRLPGMNGIELLKTLRRRGSSFPGILMTGHGDETLLERATEAEIDAILEKPFCVKQMTDFIQHRCPELFR